MIQILHHWINTWLLGKCECNEVAVFSIWHSNSMTENCHSLVILSDTVSVFWFTDNDAFVQNYVSSKGHHLMKTLLVAQLLFVLLQQMNMATQVQILDKTGFHIALIYIYIYFFFFQTWPIKWNAVSSRQWSCRYCFMDALLGH